MKKEELKKVREGIDECDRLVKMLEIQFGFLTPSEKCHYSQKVGSRLSHRDSYEGKERG